MVRRCDTQHNDAQHSDIQHDTQPNGIQPNNKKIATVSMMAERNYAECRFCPANIRLGRKGLPGTNTLAYYEKIVNNGFIGLVPV